MREWLKAWFETVQKVLYDPKGIFRTVSGIEISARHRVVRLIDR